MVVCFSTSDEAGSGTDCDDEEDCQEGSGALAPVDPVSTPKTTTDDIGFLASTRPARPPHGGAGGQNTGTHNGDTVDIITEYNQTVRPPKSTPHPITTPKRSKPTPSSGKGGGRNGSYNDGNTYERRSKNPMGLNIGLIVGIAAGVVLLLLILAYALYKYKSRDEGSYKIDESKNYSYEAYTAQAAKQPLTPSNTHANGGVSKSSSHGSKPRKKDVKEWYV